MRRLEEATLENAAKFYASEWLRADRKNSSTGRFIAGPSMVLQDFKNFTYKDEFEFMLSSFRDWASPKLVDEFNARAKEYFPDRDDAVFHALLKEKLAISPEGDHIDGCVGTVEVGVRPIDRRLFEVETIASLERRREKGLPFHTPGRTDRETRWKESLYTWPVYAGEAEERIADRIKHSAGDPGAEELPDGAFATLPDGRRPDAVGANVTNISAELCIASLDQVTLRLDEGASAANIRGRTGSQPVDPDASETGTLLFTLVCTDPALVGAVDDTDGSCSATFSSIADDTSADATATLSYCRFAAMGAGNDDHIDGNATTDASGATDWNTLAIVSGATISMTSAVVGQSQGSTAT